MPPKTKMNIVTTKKSNLSSGLLGMKFMRQVETQEKKEERESRRQELVHSSHWVIPNKKNSVPEASPAVTKTEIGFSDILEVTSTESSTQNGRRGYGKFAKEESSEGESDDSEGSDKEEGSERITTPSKRKKSQKEDDLSPEERKRREKAQAKILRQMKSISNSK